jgi:hypothetical protein
VTLNAKHLGSCKCGALFEDAAAKEKCQWAKGGQDGRLRLLRDTNSDGHRQQQVGVALRDGRVYQVALSGKEGMGLWIYVSDISSVFLLCVMSCVVFAGRMWYVL